MCAVTTIQDEGVTKTTTATTLNFVGAGVTATGSGATATITIPPVPYAYLDAKRDFGAVGDGTTDDTTSLNNAIQSSGSQKKPLVIPAGDYKLVTQILIPSNTVIFGYGARILNYTTAPEEQAYLGVPLVVWSGSATPVTNVKIYGLEIDGRRASQVNHKAGFRVQGNVSNVLVKDCYFHDNTGDGWFTLRTLESDVYVPTNITFEDVVCTNNKRQGASICIGRHITVRGGVYSNTNGNEPGAGIDIEPDVPGTACEHIVIDGVRFANNEGAGLLTDYVGEGASPIRYVTVMNCHMMANAGSGLSIRAAQDFRLSNTVIGNNTLAGIELNTYSSSPLRDIIIESCRITNNGHVGVFAVLDNPLSAAKTLKFTDLTVVDNGSSISNNYAGMQFQGPIDDVQLTGCTSQNRSSGNQAYGVITGAGVTRFRADLNNFQGNATAAKVLLDDATTRKYGASNNE
jgi:polygalacturonase